MPHSKFRAFMFFNIAWGKGGAWEWGTGTWERIGSFFKSSKDLLHYSMLFLEMSQVFLTSIVDSKRFRCKICGSLFLFCPISELHLIAPRSCLLPCKWLFNFFATYCYTGFACLSEISSRKVTGISRQSRRNCKI